MFLARSAEKFFIFSLRTIFWKKFVQKINISLPPAPAVFCAGARGCNAEAGAGAGGVAQVPDRVCPPPAGAPASAPGRGLPPPPRPRSRGRLGPGPGKKNGPGHGPDRGQNHKS